LVRPAPATATGMTHTRKLLSAMGPDPRFQTAGSRGRGPVTVTPANFPHVCHKFGIACDNTQAADIFVKHGLPSGGCSMQRLTSTFSEAKVDLANINRAQARRIYGDAVRPPTAVRPRTPLAAQQPFKAAHFAADAWREHQVAAAASSAAAAAVPTATAVAATAVPPASDAAIAG